MAHFRAEGRIRAPGSWAGWLRALEGAGARLLDVVWLEGGRFLAEGQGPDAEALAGLGAAMARAGGEIWLLDVEEPAR